MMYLSQSINQFCLRNSFRVLNLLTPDRAMPSEMAFRSIQLQKLQSFHYTPLPWVKNQTNLRRGIARICSLENSEPGWELTLGPKCQVHENICFYIWNEACLQGNKNDQLSLLTANILQATIISLVQISMPAPNCSSLVSVLALFPSIHLTKTIVVLQTPPNK